MFPEKAIGEIICITSPNSDIIGLTFLLLSYTFMELILVASPSVLLGNCLSVVGVMLYLVSLNDDSWILIYHCPCTYLAYVIEVYQRRYDWDECLS